MLIEPFHTKDLNRFLALAAEERWVADAWEFDFLLATFPEGCFCVRDEPDGAAGFVTSLRHERSGWIGNLIVDKRYRGKGVGETLFVGSLQALRTAGAETVWLTASKMGKSLYEKHGFRSIDTIIRWTGHGKKGITASRPRPDALFDRNVDHLGWGDRRDALLNVISGRGPVLAGGGACAVIQPCSNAVQIGPFAATNARDAAGVIDDALAEISQDTKVYVDAPAGNKAALKLLFERGFRNQGANELMFAGTKPEYRSEYVFGLATMGSCG